MDGFDDEAADWLARAADLGGVPVGESLVGEGLENGNLADGNLEDENLADGPDSDADPGADGDADADAKMGSHRLTAKDLLGFVHDLTAAWGLEQTWHPARCAYAVQRCASGRRPKPTSRIS